MIKFVYRSGGFYVAVLFQCNHIGRSNTIIPGSKALEVGKELESEALSPEVKRCIRLR